jgi:hypothetical protein
MLCTTRANFFVPSFATGESTDAILPLCPLVHIQANEELTKQKDQELALKDATVLAHVGVC